MSPAAGEVCVVGVAQATWRPDGSAEPLDDGQAPEPLAMWELVARRAADDAGPGAALLEGVDHLQVLYTQSWPYDDAPARLAERLGLGDGHRRYSGIGGTTPQLLVDDAASAIVAGDAEVALVVGAEALATQRRLKKAGERPAWSHRHPEPPDFPFEAPFHPAEVAHEVFQAWLTFALWDVARRAHLGVAPDAYRRRLGEVMAPLSQVAATNPHAWFPASVDVDELITPTAENRMVGYPYTKRMVAVMDVDMAAGLLLCSPAAADRLGVPEDRRVFLRSSAGADDPTYVAEHEPMHRSPAMEATFAAALSGAGASVDIHDVAHLDLYSCFASSLTFACDALGIDLSSRPLTVTGGLPFAGGPGSGYMLHSIAAMAEVLRADPGALGMVSGVGMHMTKHVASVWSTEPGEWTGRAQPTVDAPQPKVITDTWDGPATVVACSVVHGRDGAAEWGLVVCDLPDGTRTYGRIEDPALLERAETEELVGTSLTLAPADGPMGKRNIATP